MKLFKSVLAMLGLSASFAQASTNVSAQPSNIFSQLKAGGYVEIVETTQSAINTNGQTQVKSGTSGKP